MAHRASAAALGIAICVTASLHAGQDPARSTDARPPALAHDASGEQIFRQACATCHAIDGTGSPSSIVGFDLPLPNGHGFPDFNDCATNTVEPLGDWVAVASRGGPVRGLDRHMPAFGDALSPDQIERVVRYLWSFCSDSKWPRGELNFPRAFFTEKAFPENETVWTTAVTTSGSKAVSNQLVYEHRIGARGQYEIAVPLDSLQHDDGDWSSGLGDVEVAFRQTFYANHERGGIFAAGAGVTFPTGKEDQGLGNGFAIVEPFAMYGRMLGRSGFLQLHTGYEIATDRENGEDEAFVRTAVGYSFAQDQGFGRSWSPMCELIVSRPEHGTTEWDVVPQMQVSLSKLQHVLLSVGVRVPVNEREERKPQLLTYVIWDWFDGSLFQFWR